MKRIWTQKDESARLVIYSDNVCKKNPIVQLLYLTVQKEVRTITMPIKMYRNLNTWGSNIVFPYDVQALCLLLLWPTKSGGCVPGKDG